MTELTDNDIREARLESFYHLLMARKTLDMIGDGADGEAIESLEDAEDTLERVLEKPTLTGAEE